MSKQAKDVAKLLRDMADKHEASWNGQRYISSWDYVAEQVNPKDPMNRLWAILLATGYADIWNWCDEVSPTT